MKFSTMMAVLAAALAFATTACRYDKAANGGSGDGDAANLDTNGAEIDSEGEIVDSEAMSAEEGSISDIDQTGKNFEDLYTRCTDVSFWPVYFGFDATVIPAGELGKVDAVAQHLGEHADRVVVIEGHCDERGSNEYNLSLGENRAIVIRDLLVQSGVTEDRIQTRSYGEEKPAVEGHDESAWSHNRRGEFAIFQK